MASASGMRPTLRGCWKWSTVIAEKRLGASCVVLVLAFDGQARGPPGLHAAFQIEDVLHAERGSHFRRDGAALADFADEDHVVGLDRILRPGDDLAERCQ